MCSNLRVKQMKSLDAKASRFCLKSYSKMSIFLRLISVGSHLYWLSLNINRRQRKGLILEENFR